MRYCILLFLVLCSACSVTQSVNTAADIHADKDSNIVFVGFDVDISGAEVESVFFECEYVETQETSNCFTVSMQEGERLLTARAFRVPFGSYRIVRVGFMSLEQVMQVWQCQQFSDGTQICGYQPKPKYVTDWLDISGLSMGFKVSNNQAPYLGRFTVRAVVDNVAQDNMRLNTLRLEPMLVQDLQLVKDPALRAAIDAHVSAD